MGKKRERNQEAMIEIREPSAKYARSTEIPSFFGQPMLKGSYAQRDPAQLNPKAPALFYSHPSGEIWIGDALAWLRSLESESVDLIFADPPYNIKKAEWDTFESQQEYVNWSLEWIEQAARVLKPAGTLYICGFSEILADLKLPASRFFRGCRWLVWHYKNKATVVAAEQLKREWKGCDINLEYCQWAARRIELVEEWPIEKWIQYDLENAERRNSIR